MNDIRKTEPELLSSDPQMRADLRKMPPHPLDSSWHINVKDKTYGPYSGHNLKGFIEDGRMVGSTMVLPEGSSKWTMAKDDPILAGYLHGGVPAVVQPPINGRVSAAEGATVVQVTNNITQPSPTVVIDGAAAPKSAGIALVLSLLIAGLGQCYNGQIGKGIFMFTLGVLLWTVMLGWIVWIWSAVDAYQTAKAMNLRYLRLVGGGVLVT